MATTGRIVSAAKMVQLFASVDRPVDAKLNKSDFVSLMMKHGQYLMGNHFAGRGARQGTFDSTTRLMMLTYRRQQVLRDFCDPGTSKRRHFVSDETFTRAYGSALPLMPKALTSAWRAPTSTTTPSAVSHVVITGGRAERSTVRRSRGPYPPLGTRALGAAHGTHLHGISPRIWTDTIPCPQRP